MLRVADGERASPLLKHPCVTLSVFLHQFCSPKRQGTWFLSLGTIRVLFFSYKSVLFTLILNGWGRDRKPTVAFILEESSHGLGEAWVNCLRTDPHLHFWPFSWISSTQCLWSGGFATPTIISWHDPVFPCIACGIVSYLASLTGRGYWWILPVGSGGLWILITLKSLKLLKVFKFSSKNKV